MEGTLDELLFNSKSRLLAGVGPDGYVETAGEEADSAEDGEGNHQLVELLLDDVHEIGACIDQKSEIGELVEAVGQKDEPGGDGTSRHCRHEEAEGHEPPLLGGGVGQEGDDAHLGGSIGGPCYNTSSAGTGTAIVSIFAVGTGGIIVAPAEEALVKPVGQPAAGSDAILLDLRLTGAAADGGVRPGRLRYRALLLSGRDGNGDDGTRTGGGIDLVQADATVDGRVGVGGDGLGDGGVAPVGLPLGMTGSSAIGCISGRHILLCSRSYFMAAYWYHGELSVGTTAIEKLAEHHGDTEELFSPAPPVVLRRTSINFAERNNQKLSTSAEPAGHGAKTTSSLLNQQRGQRHPYY